MTDTSLISANQNLVLWAVIFGLSAFGFWAERSTGWGRRIAAPGIAIVSGLILANIGIIPGEARSTPTYGIVLGYFADIAIPLFLLSANFRVIYNGVGKMILPFAVCMVGVIVGAFLAFVLFPSIADVGQMTGMFMATYIGGTGNLIAVAEATELNPARLGLSLAVDNVVGTLFFLFIIALPTISLVRGLFRRSIGSVAGEMSTENGPPAHTTFAPMSVMDLCTALAIGIALNALGVGTAKIIGAPNFAIILTSLYALIAANIAPNLMERITGSFPVAYMLLIAFLVVLGAITNIGVLITDGSVLLLFATTIVMVHLVVLYLAGKLFNLDLERMLIASGASILGPPAAVAIAQSHGWQKHMLPGILCAQLGFAVATFLGTAIAFALM